MKFSVISLIIVLVVALAFALVFGNGFRERYSVSESERVLTSTINWLLQHDYPGLGSEWAVIAMSRVDQSDDFWLERYLLSISASLADTSTWSSTDYARVIIALTALGLDASDSAMWGRNLASSLETRSEYSIFNADVFALIALNSGQYPGDRQQYINAIVAEQLADGSWDPWDSGLWGIVDIDSTAQAIQALAPYYNDNADVRQVIDNALNWIFQQELDNSNALSQVIIALTELRRSEDADRISVYVEALLNFYYADEGAFFWQDEFPVDWMSTEQAALALAAYQRFQQGQSSLFSLVE